MSSKKPITTVEEREFVDNLTKKPVEEIKRRVSIQNEKKKNKTSIFSFININLNAMNTTD